MKVTLDEKCQPFSLHSRARLPRRSAIAAGVPVQPLILEGGAEYSMFEHFKRYPWVLETYRYPSSERLIADLGERVIVPAEEYERSVREATPQMARSPDWLKMKNPACEAVRREAEEDWS